MKYVVILLLATLLVVSALNLDPEWENQQIGNIETAVEGSELENSRVKRGAAECVRKCKRLGKRNGKCVITIVRQPFYNLTCGGGYWVCKCS